ARFGNSYHIVIADNVERKLFDADLQIFPRDDRFYLKFAADREILTNALDVNYDDDYIINKFSTENSFVRSAFKFPHLMAPTGQFLTDPEPVTTAGPAGQSEEEEEIEVFEIQGDLLNLGDAGS